MLGRVIFSAGGDRREQARAKKLLGNEKKDFIAHCAALPLPPPPPHAP